MRSDRRNELEERRVIRLLAGAAEAVPALHEAEVKTLVRLAAAPGPRRDRHRFVERGRSLVAAAAAAACMLAALHPFGGPAGERHQAPAPSGTAASLIAFPEGSALSLLLSRPVQKHA